LTESPRRARSRDYAPAVSEPLQPSAEILESGRGAGLPPRQHRAVRPGGRRRWLVGTASVVGIGALGAAAYGAYWYSATGAQPAEALPASTIGYAAIDLDPSGGQKLDALRTLKRLPAASDELGLGGDVGDVDVTSAVLDLVLRDAPCDVSADDLGSWLGKRAAVAAVPSDEGPVGVVVLQVGDAAAAEDGLTDLAGCTGREEPIGYSVDGDWAVVGWSQDDVDTVVTAREDGTLADDAGFRQWTERTGDAGVVSLYAAASAGDVLAEEISGSFSHGITYAEMACPMPHALDGRSTDKRMRQALREWDRCNKNAARQEQPVEEARVSELETRLQEQLRDFEGAAATLRFDDGSVELETAGDLETFGTGLYGGSGGADAVRTLPADTAVAVGLSVDDTWFDELLTMAGAAWVVDGTDLDRLLEDLERSTGLALPEDAELLAGRSLALGVAGDLDPDAPALSDFPVGVKVLGDPAGLEDALARVRTTIEEPEEEVLGSSIGTDNLVVGPDPAYRDRLLEDGGLGDVEDFQEVVGDVDDPSAVVYVDLDAVDHWLPQLLLYDDPAVRENVAPLSALGGSAWEDDGVPHSLLRITTD
jgi:hypothetical protein